MKISISKLVVDSFVVIRCPIKKSLWLHVMGDGFSKRIYCLSVEVFLLEKLDVTTVTGKTVWFYLKKSRGMKTANVRGVGFSGPAKANSIANKLSDERIKTDLAWQPKANI